ncbi:MAG: disulfide reductase, partial [Firmicutes bacterium]|nr:disulfide reductase [Bacillota bacterium]
MDRIGVFVCWCGLNISGTIDVKRVAEAALEIPGVVYAQDYKYCCSDPGQALMRQAINEHELNGLIIAACSPNMHETTFRLNAASAGMNPFRVECANIREQISWPHSKEKEQATEKAIEIVRSIVEKVRHDEELTPIKVPVTKRAL